MPLGALWDRNALCRDAVVSAVGPVMIATSENQYFSSDSVDLRTAIARISTRAGRRLASLGDRNPAEFDHFTPPPTGGMTSPG